MDISITIMIMSGVEDGISYQLTTTEHGTVVDDHWRIAIGRKEDNDLILSQDTFVSRHHANLHCRGNDWWLEDANSTNGTFIEKPKDPLNDERIAGFRQLKENQLFRIGRTWLRLKTD